MNVSRVLAKQQAARSRTDAIQNPTQHAARIHQPFRKLIGRIAGPKSAKPTPEAAKPITHTVKRGENLSIISARFLRSQNLPADTLAISDAVRKVAQANGIKNPDLIYPGQTIDMSSIQKTGTRPGEIAMTPRESKPVATPAPNAAVGGPEVRTLHSKRINAATAAAEPASLVRPNASPWARILEGNGTISSEFGMRRDPFTGDRAFHKGVDIAAQKGTPIKAYRSGIVSFSGWQRGYGNIVIMKHADGLETRYAHASKRLVSKGDFVRAGSEIAEVGSTGRSTGNHVHFEVRSGGKAVNPLPYLTADRLQVAKVL